MSLASPNAAAPFVRPYRPDNAFDARGVMLLIVALLVAAAVLGFAAHLASQHFYLILLFPLLIGAALGGVATLVVRATGMRNPWLAGLAGLLGGICAMAMMHAFDYRSFTARQAVLAVEDPAYFNALRTMPGEPEYVDPSDATRPAWAPVPLERAQREREFRGFVAAVRVRSFAEFIDFEARQGVTIKGSRSGDRSTNLGRVGSYIYWGVEALIVAAVAFGMAYVQSRRPYCAACGKWKGERAVGFLEADPKDVAVAVREGDLARLSAGGPTFAPTSSLLHVSSCPNGERCAAQPREDEVRLEKRAYDKRGRIVQRKTIEHAVWPASATPAIDVLFPPAPRQEGPTER